MIAADVYARILASDDLPSPGAVALELLALTRSSDFGLDQVVRIVAADPAICARIIRVANSAAFGMRNPVASVGQAVSILGVRAIARIAVEVSLLARHRSGLAEFDYGAFWTDSLARAVACQVLATQVERVPPAEAFTYGLLACIGRLALVTVYPDTYRQLLVTLDGATPAELAAAEQAVFEIDAEFLSALLLRDWGMPALHAATTGVSPDGRPASACDAEVLLTCQAGGRVARLLVGGSVERDELAAAMRAVAQLGIRAEVLAELFPEIVSLSAAAGSELEIRMPLAQSLAELYAQAKDPSRSPPPSTGRD